MSVDAELIVQEWRRLLDTVKRRIPRDRHHLIPAMLLLRTMGWATKCVRGGQFRKAASFAGKCLGIMLRHPLAVPRALTTFGERTIFVSKGHRNRHQLVSFVPSGVRENGVV